MRIHEPTLIGEVTLNIRSMLRNRSGLPRSEISRIGLAAQEERARAVDAVIVVGQVQPGLVLAGILQALQSPLGSVAQLVEIPELDRVGGTGLCARRLLVLLQPVVAERALPHAPVVLALVQHPEWT